MWQGILRLLQSETNSVSWLETVSKSTQGALRESYDVKSGAKICG